MTTSTCSAKPASLKPASLKPPTDRPTPPGALRPTSAPTTVTEFRFDDDGSLVEANADLDPSDRERSDRGAGPCDIDLRSSTTDEPIEHLVRLISGDVATVVGANAYQPEGPMTTFFSTGSSRGTIDSWSVRVASYRTNDIVSIQRTTISAVDRREQRPSLVAV